MTATLISLKMTQNERTTTNPIDHTVILLQKACESQTQISGSLTA